MSEYKNNPDKEWFSKFCHDLRSPLSIMRMNLDLFQLSDEYKNGGEKTVEFIEKINNQIDILIEKIAEEEKNISN